MTTLRLLALLGLTASTVACGNSVTGDSRDGRVALNVATETRTAALESPIASESGRETYTANGDTLVLESVEIVLAEIELEPVNSSSNCVLEDDDDDDDDDDCEDIELAGRRLDLPLGRASGSERTLTVDVPAGRYKEIEFEVERPSRTRDAALLAQYPYLDGVSVRVTGTFNGESFVYTSDLEEDFELEFRPALEVGDNGTTDFTLNFDLSRWFRGSDGRLIDPRTANSGGVNKSRVENNIEDSIEALDNDD